jgi:hypothetical protein
MGCDRGLNQAVSVDVSLIMFTMIGFARLKQLASVVVIPSVSTSSVLRICTRVNIGDCCGSICELNSLVIFFHSRSRVHCKNLGKMI